MTKKTDPAQALMTIINALEPLDESEKQWVINSASSRWGLQAQTQTPLLNVTSATNNGVASNNLQSNHISESAEAAISRNDVRTFMRLKRPIYDTQRVACLGYFHMRTTGQQGFSSKDIGKLHTDSGGTAINMTRALDNATRRARYLSNRGPREKQLTTLGEDIVQALPDQQAVTNAEEQARHPHKRRKKKKSKKA